MSDTAIRVENLSKLYHIGISSSTTTPLRQVSVQAYATPSPRACAAIQNPIQYPKSKIRRALGFARRLLRGQTWRGGG